MCRGLQNEKRVPPQKFQRQGSPEQKVSKMTESPKFWDRIAEKYSKQPIADEAAYQKKLKISREHFRPDMEVLELGCGTGSTAISHAPYVQHILATDISSQMLEIARRKAADQGITNVTFEQVTVGEFEAKDETYDAVLTLSLLHLLEDKDEAIAKIRRVLKPGGVFISSTACLGNKMSFFKIIAPIGKFFGFFPLVRVFKTQELIESITAGGFKIEHQWLPESGQSVFVVARKPG